MPSVGMIAGWMPLERQFHQLHYSRNASEYRIPHAMMAIKHFALQNRSESRQGQSHFAANRLWLSY
jgi:hypothetical protein